MNLEKLNINIELIKLFLNGLFSIFIYLKIMNSKIRKIEAVLYSAMIAIISIITIYIRYTLGYDLSIISFIILLSIVTRIIQRKDLGETILLITMSYSINYIVTFIGIIIMFFINLIKPIQSDVINLLIMTIIQIVSINYLSKIKRIKYGIDYLKKSTQNEYLETIIFNVSAIIIFCLIIFYNVDKYTWLSQKMQVVFIAFSVIMVLTIKKSIEAYYKQKLLVQDLNETKAELEEKKKEVEELEKENLGFNKRSHSLAYKQKSLEFKLNKLLMKSEFADELGLTDEFKKISKQMKENEKLPKLDTTGILEVDDMLNMMQEECRLNDIDFSLQIKGNIYQMTNNYIDKEDLATLLADHIKDAIIAINHTDNLNKSIMVRLGKIDDCFAVYFYDSGVEFPEEIFNELGERPITAYANEGGTGLGFMNTFDVLRKKNASLIVENLGKPSIDNYTKIIKIIFDNENKIMFDKTKIL